MYWEYILHSKPLTRTIVHEIQHTHIHTDESVVESDIETNIDRSQMLSVGINIVGSNSERNV